MSEEKQFYEKMVLLNNEFVNYLQRMIRATPHADLSPSLNSYLKHVADLDDMYGRRTNGSTITQSNSSGAQTSTLNNFGGLTQANNGGGSSIFNNLAQSTNNGVGSSLTLGFGGFAQTNNNGVGPSLTLGFGAQTNNVADNGDDGEEHEEPPKPEEVEQTEKDAILSYKCVLHCLIKGIYEKRGVSYLSIKDPKESKKQLVIRDATAIGRLWTNTLVNDSLKWTKVDDKKIRISYPRLVEAAKKDDREGSESASSSAKETEIETMLVRLGTAEELSTLLEELEKKDLAAN